MTEVTACGSMGAMITRKRIVVAVLAVLVLGGVAAFRVLRLGALAHLGAGYSAQQTCACLFVSKRTLDSCRQDLDPLAQKLVRLSPGDSHVSATALGFSSATSRHEPGYGCSLVD